ncbi:helix-turn-helix domain-containing protein [Paenibacillus sanguinis]|uniref:helix-turn-helix domain-containing protein n=1 Tax=Paenibacillus sanguinis TaxID=225906 RepID=UPI000381EFDE|nr:AraC family transcriptional regulator [Paenibacillus sanguinis]
MIKPEITEFMLPDMDSTFKIFAAHLRTVTGEWSYPKHSHPLFEVNLLLEGCQEIVVGTKRYVQEAGDLLLLRPEEIHESRALGSEPMTYYCLHFDVDERMLRELLYRQEPALYTADSPLSRLVRPSLDRLIELTSHGADARLADKMRTLAAVFELFAGLSEGLAENEEGGAAIRMNRLAAEIASGLERCVEEAAVRGEGVTLQETGSAADDREVQETVAAVTAGLGYSPSSCNRIFRSVYGMSPRQYLSALKLKKAKLLLLEPQLSVESVSLRLGYKDIAHFSRQFKRWTGESPLKFRGKFHV